MNRADGTWGIKGVLSDIIIHLFYLLITDFQMILFSLSFASAYSPTHSFKGLARQQSAEAPASEVYAPLLNLPADADRNPEKRRECCQVYIKTCQHLPDLTALVSVGNRVVFLL